MPIHTYTVLVTIATDSPPAPTAVASRLLGALDFASSRGGPFHTSRWPNVWLDAAYGDRAHACDDPLFASAKDLHRHLCEAN
jgi:hypothetical protein